MKWQKILEDRKLYLVAKEGCEMVLRIYKHNQWYYPNGNIDDNEYQYALEIPPIPMEEK